MIRHVVVGLGFLILGAAALAVAVFVLIAIGFLFSLVVGAFGGTV
jgi:hypothetical protein